MPEVLTQPDVCVRCRQGRHEECVEKRFKGVEAVDAFASCFCLTCYPRREETAFDEDLS